MPHSELIFERSSYFIFPISDSSHQQWIGTVKESLGRVTIIYLGGDREACSLQAFFYLINQYGGFNPCSKIICPLCRLTFTD